MKITYSKTAQIITIFGSPTQVRKATDTIIRKILLHPKLEQAHVRSVQFALISFQEETNLSQIWVNNANNGLLTASLCPVIAKIVRDTRREFAPR